MALSFLRTALVLSPLLLWACSGKVASTGSGDGGSGSSSGGQGCVDVALSTYDTSCRTSADCITIAVGELCPGNCACGGSTINVSGQARYAAAIASIDFGMCGCPLEGTPQCLQNECTICLGRPEDPPACGSSVADAGRPDAGTCVDVDLSTYDTSCQKSSDCAGITSGELCTGSCECGGSTINVDGLDRYNTQISGIVAAGCPCAAPDIPTCVNHQCVLCEPDQPGCGDGG